MRKFVTTFLITAAVVSASALPTRGLQGKESGPALKKTPANVAMEAPAIHADKLADLPLISETPAGELVKYSKDAIFYGIDFYGQLYASADFGRISEVVYADGGKVYFKNPFCGCNTETWLEGTDNGETVSVTFPQRIFSETYPDWENDPEGILTKTDNYYAFKLIYSNDGEKSKMEIDVADPVITFTKTDKGLVMEGDSFVGMLIESIIVDQETGEEQSALNWTGYADSKITLAAVNETPNILPDGLATEEWVFSDGMAYRFVSIGFDNDDIYIRGMLSTMPESVIKGKVADGQIVFEGVQYVGQDQRLEHFAFFMPATVTVNEDPEVPEELIFTQAESIAFTYDTEEKIIYTYEEEGFAFSSISDGIFLLEGYYMPQFNWQDMATPMTPDDPEIYSYDIYEDMGFGAISYNIPDWSTDGRVMLPDNLYYNFFINDEILVLYPDEYLDLEEPMENIPAFYEDSDIYYWGYMYEAVIYAMGFDRIGVRSLYVNADGTTTYSNIVYNDGTVVSAIDKISEEMPSVTKMEYYTLDGRRISSPENGTISIKRTFYSDGSTKTTKIIKR